ncbi:MAG: hypothetical protein KDD47_07145, partial [Acidobacteria bacterium]|nr:hypothetical protein [Acidobacteriota bacterium]
YFDDVVWAELSTDPAQGGSHGGRGGGPADQGVVYGSLFEPSDVGAAGGGRAGGAGGGAIRLVVGDEAVLDGSVLASGVGASASAPSGAGGSIYVDAAAIRGEGLLEASGADAPAGRGAGSGGRVALVAPVVEPGLLSRTAALGGVGDTSARSGAAGTVFVLQGSDTLGELILDNGGVATSQETELPGFFPGVLEVIGADSVTDTEASFVHGLSGMEVFFSGNGGDLWPIVANAHFGDTLSLDVTGHPLTAQTGDSYEGLYRFDRLTVRGGALGISVAGVDSVEGVTVEAGSTWNPAYLPSLVINEPSSGTSFAGGSLVTATVAVSSTLGVQSVELSLGQESAILEAAPYTASLQAPVVTEVTSLPLTATLVDGSGHRLTETVTIQVEPNSASPPTVAITCPSAGAFVAPGTGLDLIVEASHADGIQRVELLEGTGETILATDATVPYALRYEAPAGTPAGSLLELRVRAVSAVGSSAEAALSVPVVSSTVLTADTTLEAVDLSLDGQSVVVAGATLTVEGAHSFQN